MNILIAAPIVNWPCGGQATDCRLVFQFEDGASGVSGTPIPEIAFIVDDIQGNCQLAVGGEILLLQRNLKSWNEEPTRDRYIETVAAAL